jgi:5-methylcytosine-specific restriction endonuclease McrA
MNTRYATDPEWREKVLQKERHARATGKYRDQERARYRKRYDADPNFRVKFWESTHRRRARRYKVFKQATVRVGPVDGLVCSLCGVPAEAWDHVVPILIGGPHIDANLRPICQSCNSQRPKLGNDVTEGEAARALNALLDVPEDKRDETWELSAWACAEIVDGRLPPPIKVTERKKKPPRHSA